MTKHRQVLFIAVALMVQPMATGIFTTTSYAQSLPQLPTGPTTAATTQDNQLVQIQLSEKQVQALIASQSEMTGLLAALPEDQEDLDPKTRSALDKTARKFGFKDFADYQAVGDNVILVLDGFDPDTKSYVGKETLLKAELDQIRADKSMRPADRRAAILEIKDMMSQVEPVKFPENIAIVTKYLDRLSEIFPSES